MRLQAALKEQILTEVHQNHGHQGVELTLELLHQCCYLQALSGGERHEATGPKLYGPPPGVRAKLNFGSGLHLA